MNTKHTPGPWIARCMDTYGGTDWTKNGGRIRGRNSQGQEVAIAHIYSEPQAEANAALIAAAPALLKALEPFAQAIERFESQGAYNSEASDLLSVCNILNRYGKINLGHLRQAHAAIAQATPQPR